MSNTNQGSEETLQKLVDTLSLEVSPLIFISLQKATSELTENIEKIVIVRKAFSDLVTRHNWTWTQALERTILDHVPTRIINLKNSIVVNETEDVKFQTAFAFFMSQECNVEKYISSQILYMQKMTRFCLQDEGKVEPQKFFNMIVRMNDLIP